MVIGTAGHVDHGKTTLVRALTGVDTDRLPEEKARGITIDLGFAHASFVDPSSGGPRMVSIIDVPGHERFVRTMVAGTTGIDLVLLVVAADEGIMPQTREHLDVIRLLGIRRCVVALTKTDLVEPSWLELVRADVEQAVSGTFAEPPPVLACSAVTGAGLSELGAALASLGSENGERRGDPAGPLRLPVDRVFTLKGIGTVATGTLASGTLAEDDSVVVLPGGATGRVRSIQVRGERRRQARSGERTAASLPGIERQAFGRGEVITRPGELHPSAIVDVELSLLPVCADPLKTRSKVLFHALTTQENATVVLLESGQLDPGAVTVAQLHLDRGVALLPGDRFILRGFRVLPGHGTTLGGGRVIRVQAPKRRRPDRHTSDRLWAMARAPRAERVALEIAEAGQRGLSRADLLATLGLGPVAIADALDTLLARGRIIGIAGPVGSLVDRQVFEDLGRNTVACLDAFHRAMPLASGMSREELRVRAGGRSGPIEPPVLSSVLADLTRQGKIDPAGDLVRRAGFSPATAERQSDALVERLHEIFRRAALAPPLVQELPATLGVPAPEARTAFDILVRRGDVVRIKPELFVDRAAVDELRERLLAHMRVHGQITSQEWKQMTGQSRKYAIPLAEHFDDQKLTLRIKDVRRLRQS